ncbi:uncharacterized protein BDW70DRAFT_152607 [Aspergillus foveolatus]|uniref:uncharacterized protein n=1 Tax=Aspergillus foveolatus TaxID=210207 RepID=UPI003CCD8A56
MRKLPLFRSLHRPIHSRLALSRDFQKTERRRGPMMSDTSLYTSGRWLINKEHQLKQRYVKFTIDNLCSQASSLFGPETKCVRIVKLEGNFNKAFLLTIDDGNEVIAKIPCANAGMAFLTTASEVATLKFFLQSHLTIRVPEVYAWSSDSTNPVDAEYIIGRSIWKPFLRNSLPVEYSRYTLPSDLDPNGVFCIGPSCSRAVCHKTSIQSDVGPWNSILDSALSMPRRKLARAAANRGEVQRHLNRSSDSQSVDEYCDLLREAVLVLPVLSRDLRVLKVANSVIWHTDLHLGNIYVSSDDPTTIEGLDPNRKEKVAEGQTLAAQSKYYEMSCLAYNKSIYDAMKLDRRLWEPFTCCQLFSNGSMVPLWNSLARLFHDWKNLRLPGCCPFELTENDLQRHSEQVQQYEDTVYLWDIVKSQLRTDDSGWIPSGNGNRQNR